MTPPRRAPTWRLSLLAVGSALFALCLVRRGDYLFGTALTFLRWPLAVGMVLVAASFVIGRRLSHLPLALLPFGLLVGEWTLVAWSRARPQPRVERGQRFSVVTHNVLYAGAKVEQSAAMLAAQDADLLALQEFTPSWERALTPLLEAKYPHRAHAPRPGASGYGLYSKHPLRNVQLLGDSSWPFAQCFDVAVSEGLIHACNAHLYSPAGALAQRSGRWDALRRNEQRRAREWAQLRAYLDKVAPPGEMRLVLGDLNTMESEPLYRTIAGEYVDVYRLLRMDSGATWPNGLWRVPFPLVRIDYVLSSGPLTPLSAGIPGASGSDHMAVRALFALPGKGFSKR